MVTKITNLFKKKSVNLGTPFMFWGGYSSRLDLNEIDVAFKDWTFACIKRRSTSLASLNWYGATKKQDGTNAPLDKNHWLSMLLEKPNPYMTFSEMIEFTQMWVDVTGNMFWRVYKEGSTILGMMPLIVINSKYELDSNNMIIGYTIDGKFYEKNDIIHFKNLQPSLNNESLLTGKSLVTAAIDSITSNKEVNEYLKSFFMNEGLPPLIAYLDDMELTDEQKEIFKSSWENRIKHNPIAAMVDKRMNIQPLNTGGATQNTANIIPALDAINKENIAAIFGIPKGLITGDEQNRSVSETNERNFMLRTINPLAKRISQTITNALNDMNLIVTTDYYLDQNREFELTALQFGLTSGVITPNEYRSFLGYEPLGQINVVETNDVNDIDKSIKKKVKIG
jgi:HK97 family phage portal protein